jgi:hypothetical protein
MAARERFLEIALQDAEVPIISDELRTCIDQIVDAAYKDPTHDLPAMAGLPRLILEPIMKKRLQKWLNKEIAYPNGSTLTVGESFIVSGLTIFSLAVMTFAVILMVKTFVEIFAGLSGHR